MFVTSNTILDNILQMIRKSVWSAHLTLNQA